MTTAAERVIARAQARTAAMGAEISPPPPAIPDAEPEAQGDVSAQLADLNETVAGLAQAVSEIQAAMVEDTLADVDDLADPAMAAALPDPFTPAEGEGRVDD